MLRMVFAGAVEGYKGVIQYSNERLRYLTL
ncbi:hypothetical protein [Pseudomonas sp. 37 R 15]|nr:hypothetical protein [Pseudomonas sp. 37 R 15]